MVCFMQILQNPMSHIWKPIWKIIAQYFTDIQAINVLFLFQANDL